MAEMTGHEHMTPEARIRANNARIAELKAKLEEIENTERFTNRDLLDLQLAANRARAYDLSRATGHLSDVDSRIEGRRKDRREMDRMNNNRIIDNDLKLSGLIKERQELQIKKSQATSDPERDTIDAILEDNGNRIRALGGTPSDYGYQGPNRGTILNDFYNATTNTSTGLRFKDDVTPEQRKAITDNLRSVGMTDLANQVEALSTKSERIDAAIKMKQKKQQVKDMIQKANNAIENVEIKQSKHEPISDSEWALAQMGRQQLDSLHRALPTWVEFKNNRGKFITKD